MKQKKVMEEKHPLKSLNKKVFKRIIIILRIYVLKYFRHLMFEINTIVNIFSI